VLETFWKVVDYTHVVSCAGTSVTYSDHILQIVARASFFRTTLLAPQHWLSAHDGAKSDWCCRNAEASFEASFSFAAQADTELFTATSFEVAYTPY
jgi:hypothetical protein